MTKSCSTLTAVTAAVVMLIPVSAGQAIGAQAGPLATPSLSIGLLGVAEISHDGRWLLGGSATSDGAIILDRDTGAVRGVESSDVDPSEFRGFVRDNPVLELTVRADPDWRGAFLTNSSTAKRQRIDTSSKGVPLTPRWRTTCDDECADTDKPGVYLTTESISRNGRKVAFCANLDTPRKPTLYIKDLRTGRLTRTKLVCGLLWGEGGQVIPPQMSDNGEVVHVKGDLIQGAGYAITAWRGDHLYFTSTRKTRALKGSGSMTRDGGTVFLTVGTRKPNAADRTKGRVGAYNVKTRKTVRLPGQGQVYGTNVFLFDAFTQSSRRGRYVVNATSVVDRKSDKVADINAILAAAGYQPYTGSDQPYPPEAALRTISGDGTVVIAPVGVPYTSQYGFEEWNDRQDVIVTGW